MAGPGPTLAAVLVFAAVRSVKPADISIIRRTAMTSRIGLVTTFLATPFLPIQAAVGISVALSLLLQLRTEAMEVTVVEMVPQPDVIGSTAAAVVLRLRGQTSLGATFFVVVADYAR